MTNILLLPQISVVYTVSTNSDWTDSIQFMQPAPNQTQPLDITGIAFYQQVKVAAGRGRVILDLSTTNGLLVNGGTDGTLTLAVPTKPPLAGSGAPPAYMSYLSNFPASLVTDIVAVADGHRKSLCEKSGPGTVNVNTGVTW